VALLWALMHLQCGTANVLPQGGVLSTIRRDAFVQLASCLQFMHNVCILLAFLQSHDAISMTRSCDASLFRS
jgi:hypothetical protein